MAVSGIVVTLRSEYEVLERTIALLTKDPRLELGRVVDLGANSGARKLPAVLECATMDEAIELLEWVSSVEGVDRVDLVFIDLLTAGSEETSAWRAAEAATTDSSSQ
ncbi:MAG: hypothetical protein ACKVX7_08530 [Planctomycetota bacterium]